VEKGGATVFPFLKLRVQPKKGSAIFWYNLHQSGHGNPNTLHSGCPVLLGSKWVAKYEQKFPKIFYTSVFLFYSKWIYNLGQELRRKCKPSDFSKVNIE
jgi:prolyl 4-hydroxylase